MFLLCYIHLTAVIPSQIERHMSMSNTTPCPQLNQWFLIFLNCDPIQESCVKLGSQVTGWRCGVSSSTDQVPDALRWIHLNSRNVRDPKRYTSSNTLQKSKYCVQQHFEFDRSCLPLPVNISQPFTMYLVTCWRGPTRRLENTWINYKPGWTVV